MRSEHSINGELIKLRREERGWTQSDLAIRACMSIKQIRQIEEGGTSAFYSEPVKLTATKKVATLLGISMDVLFPDDVQAHPVDAVTEPEAPTREETVEVEQVDLHAHVQEATVEVPVVAPDEVAKPKISLGFIAALFVAALAVAAWMRPDADPAATEPPPPLQAVPAEADAAASAASAAVEAASAEASSPAASVASATKATQLGAPSPALAASKPAQPASAAASK